MAVDPAQDSRAEVKVYSQGGVTTTVSVVDLQADRWGRGAGGWLARNACGVRPWQRPSVRFQLLCLMGVVSAQAGIVVRNSPSLAPLLWRSDEPEGFGGDEEGGSGEAGASDGGGGGEEGDEQQQQRGRSGKRGSKQQRRSKGGGAGKRRFAPSGGGVGKGGGGGKKKGGKPGKKGGKGKH